MTDSFLRDHQPGIDHMHEENAINDLKNGGIYPNIDHNASWFCEEDDGLIYEDFDESTDEDCGFVTEYCKSCDCILRSDEGDICCSCEKDYE